MNPTCHTVGFYRTSTYLDMQSLILLLQTCVSVSLSNCYTLVVLYLNECIYCQTLSTSGTDMPILYGRYHRYKNPRGISSAGALNTRRWENFTILY